MFRLYNSCFALEPDDRIPIRIPTQTESEVPDFKTEVVQDRTDGYWLEKFHFDSEDKCPGLLAHGLTTGDITFLDNPVNQSKKHGNSLHGNTTGWQQYTIAKFNTPVAIAIADVSGNGNADVIICHDYGPTMWDCNPNGGKISWLENPGRKGLENRTCWKQRCIGRWPAMHRLKAGFFTQSAHLEIIGLPVVRGPHDYASPVPIHLYSRPDNVLNDSPWPSTVIDDQHFSIIHDVADKQYDGATKSMVVASREGLHWLSHKDGKWNRKSIGQGAQKQPGQSPSSLDGFWGCGSVDVGKVGDDPFAYIATIDPFHGTNVTVYTKVKSGLYDFEWKRHVLDVYGSPCQMKNIGTGPGHHIICGDFDGDGTDEFLIALMGHHPHQGVFYYKPVDLSKGIFAKWSVTENSAARIAVGDFNGNGKLDFATIAYNVLGYHEAPNPKVWVHFNNFAGTPEPSQFTVAAWNKEPVVYMPHPSQAKPERIALVEVADYRLELEVLPPGYTIDADFLEPLPEGIKVLWGAVQVDGEETPRKALGIKRFTKGSSMLNSKGYQAAKDVGAVLIRFMLVDNPRRSPWKDTMEVPCNMLLKGLMGPSAEYDFSAFHFVKVEDLWWGEPFKGKDFWNATGLHFRFHDNDDDHVPQKNTVGIAHMQFWTAGPTVDAKLHNHNDAVFAEIHLSLSAGTGKGGMEWLPSEPTIGPPECELPDHKPEDIQHLDLAELDEHGGFWFADYYDTPLRRPDHTVCYTWHKWQAGEGGANGLDIWAAFEFYPDEVVEVKTDASCCK